MTPMVDAQQSQETMMHKRKQSMLQCFVHPTRNVTFPALPQFAGPVLQACRPETGTHAVRLVQVKHMASVQQLVQELKYYLPWWCSKSALETDLFGAGNWCCP